MLIRLRSFAQDARAQESRQREDTLTRLLLGTARAEDPQAPTGFPTGRARGGCRRVGPAPAVVWVRAKPCGTRAGILRQAQERRIVA